MRENSSTALINFPVMLKGVIAALIIAIIGCTIMGTIYHFTALSEGTLPRVAAILFYFSIFIGSLLAAKETGSKGFLHGIGVAILFVLLGWLIAKVFLGTGIGFVYILKKAVISCLSGAIGGIIGVGLAR